MFVIMPVSFHVQPYYRQVHSGDSNDKLQYTLNTTVMSCLFFILTQKMHSLF
jgi:hypothetical protein